MKATSLTRIATIAVACLFSFPLTSQGKDKHKSSGSSHHHNDRDWRDYSSRPRSSFSLSFGTGYAGRGYYYGPPNATYYYARPEVRYYATREAIPRTYYRSSSIDVAVQRELARRGYYHGYIDGAIGPQSRSAIARYQQNHGFHVTGTINSSLLHSLGL